MDAVERVVLAKKERVSVWLLAGYKTLVEGPETLTMDRVKLLDWETIAKLFSIQHRLLVGGQFTVLCPHCTRRHRSSVGVIPKELVSRAEVMLEEEFRNELHHIREEEYAKGWKVRPPPVEEQGHQVVGHQVVGSPWLDDHDDDD